MGKVQPYHTNHKIYKFYKLIPAAEFIQYQLLVQFHLRRFLQTWVQSGIKKYILFCQLLNPEFLLYDSDLVVVCEPLPLMIIPVTEILIHYFWFPVVHVFAALDFSPSPNSASTTVSVSLYTQNMRLKHVVDTGCVHTRGKISQFPVHLNKLNNEHDEKPIPIIFQHNWRTKKITLGES